MTDESKIRDAADAARGLLEAAPIYEDALQPGAQQVGKALETVGKAVNLALAPIGALVWGFKKIEEWVVPALEARLLTTPPERIVTPPPLIAGPAIEALRFAGGEESLRDLYANLLATAMDTETAHTAHPAFVEMLRQLSPDEAKLLSHISHAPNYELCFVDVVAAWEDRQARSTMLTHFSTLAEAAGCAFSDLVTSYLDNLARLRIVELKENVRWATDEAKAQYEAVSSHPRVREHVTRIEQFDKGIPEIVKGCIEITTLGRQFIASCVDDRSMKVVKAE
jgi:Abortive infection alpha